MDSKLFIPVLLGTPRQGRMSEHAAKFMLGELKKKPDVETEYIDIRDIKLPGDEEGEDIKNSGFSDLMKKADGLVIVTPEYNQGYPGTLKHLLDTNLKEYIHKAVGICGVSAGPWGGTRVIINLLPVLRELGLVNIFWDMNFNNIYKLFDAEGIITDQSYYKKSDKFLNELIWMAKTLRYGRENISI